MTARWPGRAPTRHAVGAPAADELLEDPRPLLLRYARSAVAHSNPQQSVLATREEVDGGTARRVAERVHDEVADDLSEPSRIGGHDGRRSRRVDDDALLPLLGDHAVVRRDLRDEGRGIDLLRLDGDASLLELRHLEELFGESLEPLHVPSRGVEELALCPRERSGMLAQQELQGAAQHGERRAELVRDGRQELALQTVGLAQGLGLARLAEEALLLRA